ncbi:NTP transferase domain-containing protein [Nocardia sp. ET3-3]|uniref:NTP transferase domain-containing protein n=1 Tax=Nocardia terrae TaxID=2675851 RepID=A0A7K1VAE9_9NOCA|nr:NTP transferase domain-containing protein [Nocardia terrae]
MNPERCDGIVLAAGAGRRYGMPKVLAEGGAWLRTAVTALRAGGCERIFVVLGATGPARRAADGRWMVSESAGIALPADVRPVWTAEWEIGVSASMRAGLAAAAAPGISVPAGRTHGLGMEETAGHAAYQPTAPRIFDMRKTAVRNSDTETSLVRSSTMPGSAHPAGASAGADGSDGRGRDGAEILCGETGLAADGAGVMDGERAPAAFVAIMPVDTPDVGPEVVARVIAAARASESRLARAFFGTTPGHPVVLGREHWAGVRASADGNSGAGIYLRQRADMVCVTCDDLATGIDRDHPADGAL